MTSTVYTQADLDAIDTAIAKGVTVVKYTDKEIRYRDLSEMFQVREHIAKCLGLINQRGARRLAAVSKGLC